MLGIARCIHYLYERIKSNGRSSCLFVRAAACRTRKYEIQTIDRTMKNITVFCAASDRIAARYFEEAGLLGKWIGEHNKTLVYGGASGGLMEETARNVRENGGEVIGIITQRIIDMGRTSRQPTELTVARSMSERKQALIDRGDAIVVLPGGIGTLDELFDALTTKMLGYHDKPIILCNTDRCYDILIEQIEQLIQNEFANPRIRSLFDVADDAQQCCSLLEKLTPSNE